MLVLKFTDNKDLLSTHVIRFRQFYKVLRVDENEFTISFNKEDKLTGILILSYP